MMSVHSMPDAFSAGECERINVVIALASSAGALLDGQKRDSSLRRA